MSKTQCKNLKPKAKPKIRYLIIPLFAVIFSGIALERSAEAKSVCQDVEVIFVHGADSDITDNPDVTAWSAAFKDQMKLQNDLKIGYYSLGEQEYSGNRYIGADIGFGSLKEIKATLETFISAGKSGEFQNSVKTGIAELKEHLRETLASCPKTKFVFGGYSEGAYLLHRFFREDAASIGLTPENVVYIATFGDPKLYLKEGEGTNPPACRNEDFSNYRVYAPNCRAHSGILGAEQPDYFPEIHLENTGLWCTKKDVMCSNYFDIFNLAHLVDDHLNYASKEPYPYKQAAILVRQRLAQIFPDKIESPKGAVHSAARDTAILIDTTGSMSSVINKYKTEALKIAKTTIENGGRIALFEYRDLRADGKELVPRELCDFSCTYEQFSEKIGKITVSGGGDTPESVLSASLGVMDTLKWQKGATKSIVLLTDATYHDADFDGTTLSDVIKRSLEIDPVNFYIVAPSSITSEYSALASGTNGKVFSLSSGDIALSSETLLNRPDLNFQFETYAATAGEIATFLLNTTARDVDHFEWDLDMDGIFELTTSSPNISSLYSAPTSGFIQAKVITKSGLSSTASALLTITASEDLGPAPIITDLEITPSVTTAKVSFKTDAEKTVIFLDDSALGLTSETKFTITDLTSGSHTLTLTPISKTGLRGESVTKTFNTKTKIPTAPNTGLAAR
ncbi:cutinase family protein [Candidatus Saccharibacteria bacterium]|nr:cutinase family protein [Candidatus Saccharibacteria bacterium]